MTRPITLAAALLVASCVGRVDDAAGTDEGTPPARPARDPDGPRSPAPAGSGPMGAAVPAAAPAEAPGDAPELRGTQGRDIAEYWTTIPIPLSENTKLLGFAMLRNEVTRAIGRGWEVNGKDQWAANARVLGAADFVGVWQEDRVPNQQKMLTVRRAAFEVCGAAVAADTGAATRALFRQVDPGRAIAPSDALVGRQVSELWTRVFLEPPPAAEQQESLALLSDVQQMTGSSGEAWRALCAAYLTSARFLAY